MLNRKLHDNNKFKTYVLKKMKNLNLCHNFNIILSKKTYCGKKN